MKQYISTTILLFILSSFHVPPTKQTLLVSNLDHLKGRLYIGWYKSADDFRKPDKAVFRKIVEVDNKKMVEVPFDDVPPGVYAVAVFLDKNGNGKIDTNMFGIPKEKYGFSNNKYPLMRAATFQESAFEVGEKQLSIPIRLKG